MPTGVYKRTEKMKENMIKAQQKRKERDDYICSPETIKKISEIKQKRKQELGYINSPKTRKKMSIAQQRRKERDGYIHSPETRRKISEAHLKRKEKLGYINSPEARKKLSEFRKGIIFSDEHKKNISKSRLKRKQELGNLNSLETRKKIGDANRGENSYMWNPNRAEIYAPYGEKFYNQNIRNEKWNIQNGRDMLTGTMLDPNKKPAYHHIDYCKSNDDPDNHCFISRNNHSRITGYQRNPIKSERYKKILQENTQALKNGQIPKYWSQINKELFRQEKLKQLDLSLYI